MKTKRFGFGFVVEDSEWSLSLMWSSGQDGRTLLGGTMAVVDGGLDQISTNDATPYSSQGLAFLLTELATTLWRRSFKRPLPTEVERLILKEAKRAMADVFGD